MKLFSLQMGPKVEKKAAAKPAVEPAVKKTVAAAPSRSKTVEKKIGGEKNGGSRKVVLPRQVRFSACLSCVLCVHLLM
jgi:hypothetical protein